MLNIIIILCIAFYSAFVIYSMLKNYIKAKKEGTPLGCYSCSSHKNGSCTNQKCTSQKQVNKMIKQAKKNLNDKREKKND